MKTIYLREYKWGFSGVTFDTFEEARDFDNMPDEFVRVVEFREVEPS
jgi:hypothetical protein